MRYFLFLLFCVLTGCVKSIAPPLSIDKSPTVLPQQAEVLKWYPLDDSTKIKAQSENKIIIIQVILPDNESSVYMDKLTFTDPKVIHLLNEHYLMIKVNAINIQNQFDKFPTTVFMTPWGNEFTRITGLVLPGEFAEILKEVTSRIDEIIDKSKNATL